MTEDEVKEALLKEFHHWMRGQTVSADDNGNTIYPERDVRRFVGMIQRMLKRQ